MPRLDLGRVSDSSSRLRVIAGGGPDPPDPNQPLDAHEFFDVFERRSETTPQRLFATYVHEHKRRKSEHDHGFFGFARRYARILTDAADLAGRGEVSGLLNLTGVRTHESDTVIWDDARPRRMHVWPEGGDWGDVPPMNTHWVESPVQTYTVCGIRVTNHLRHSRASRGEWANHFATFEKAQKAADDEAMRLTTPEYEHARRICPDCAVAAASFADCLPGDAPMPPDWWLAPVRATASEQITAALSSEKRFTSLDRLQAEADKAYRMAVRRWLAHRLSYEGEPALRRLFGRELDNRRAGGRRTVFSEYDQLARAAVRSAGHKPHELLTESDWQRLLTPYLLGNANAKDDDSGPLAFSATAHFRDDVQARLTTLGKKTAERKRRKTASAPGDGGV